MFSVVHGSGVFKRACLLCHRFLSFVLTRFQALHWQPHFVCSSTFFAWMCNLISCLNSDLVALALEFRESLTLAHTKSIIPHFDGVAYKSWSFKMVYGLHEKMLVSPVYELKGRPRKVCPALIMPISPSDLNDIVVAD